MTSLSALNCDAPVKRVLFVITGLETGGAEMTLIRLLRALDRSEFEPLVVSLRGEGPLSERLRSTGTKLVSLNARSLCGLFGSIRQLARIIKEWRPDIVQGWMYHGNIASFLATKLSGRKVPILFKIHQTPHTLAHFKPTTAMLIHLGKYFSRRVDKVVYCAESSREVHEERGYSVNRGVVIEDGFDTENYEIDDEARLRERAALGINSTAIVIGRIGRLHPQKDYDGFLLAMKRVMDEHPEVQVVAIGPGVSLDHQPFLDLVNTSGIDKARCHFLGRREDVASLMNAFDIFVNPSKIEAFPNVVGEALLCGVPCVVTDVGDSARMVLDAGMVVPPGDTERLRLAVSQCVELSSEKRRMLGRAGRESIASRFSVGRITACYEDLLRQVA